MTFRLEREILEEKCKKKKNKHLQTIYFTFLQLIWHDFCFHNTIVFAKTICILVLNSLRFWFVYCAYCGHWMAFGLRRNVEQPSGVVAWATTTIVTFATGIYMKAFGVCCRFDAISMGDNQLMLIPFIVAHPTNQVNNVICGWVHRIRSHNWDVNKISYCTWFATVLFIFHTNDALHACTTANRVACMWMADSAWKRRPVHCNILNNRCTFTNAFIATWIYLKHFFRRNWIRTDADHALCLK